MVRVVGRMNRLKPRVPGVLSRPVFVLPLIVCLLLVPALAAPSAVSHEVQHSHHNAATHSSPLCAWLCGVAQGYEISEAGFIPTLSVQSIQVVQADPSIDNLKRLRRSSRSPPSGSF